MEFLVISLSSGISYGLSLLMLSPGLTLILSMMDVLSFAHVGLYILGVYFAYVASDYLGFWSALIVASLLVDALDAAAKRFDLRTVHRHGHVAGLLFTSGLAYLVEKGMKLVWDLPAVPCRVPDILGGPLFTLFTPSFPKHRTFMILVSLLVLVSIFLLFTYTRIGLVTQATFTHPDMVEAPDRNVPRVFTLVSGDGCTLAGLVGVIDDNVFVIKPSTAIAVGSIIFVMAVVGGMGSPVDAFVASLLVGCIQAFAAVSDILVTNALGKIGVILNPDVLLIPVWNLTIAQVAPVPPYLLLVLTLIFRPHGLMGTWGS